MGLNKVRLGDFIEVSTANNKTLRYGSDLIRGVTTEGFLRDPKGDVRSVDLAPYKIVRQNAFVYNPSRLDLGSIARCTEELCIVSHLYIVFYLNAAGLRAIDPAWLYMYLRRSEFMREVTFRNFGSQRPEFNFKKMSDIELPLPPIEVQRKYVAIYEAVLANQRAYERGLDDLKLTCDALVEKLMREVRHEAIGPYIEQSDARNSARVYGEREVRGLSVSKCIIKTNANLTGVNLGNYKIICPDELAYVADTSRRGEKISIALNESDETYITSAINTVFRVKKSAEQKLLPGYLMLFFGRSEFDRYARFNSWGSARETFDWAEMCDVRIPLTDIAVQRYAVELYQTWRTRLAINERLKAQLKDLCPILIRGSVEEASR